MEGDRIARLAGEDQTLRGNRLPAACDKVGGGLIGSAGGGTGETDLLARAQAAVRGTVGNGLGHHGGVGGFCQSGGRE